jgi:hypothetical protein
VSWDAPTSDGGSAIQSYLVKVYADGSGTVLTSSVVNSGLAASMTATVTGLTNATTYEMTVTASQESAGTQYFGVESERARVTVGRPAAPTNVAAAVHNTPTGTQIRLTWTQVPDQTGLTITHYRWKHKVGSGAFTIGSAIATGTACSGTSCSAVVTGLTNGTTYAFVVEAAITGPNWGMTSAEVGGTPIGATSAPGVTTEALNGKAGYSITEPASLNGAEVTRYEVTYRPTAGGAWSSPAIEILPGQAIDPIEGLTNGTSYTISVIAVNAAGNSSAGTATVVPATTPDAPQNVRARPGSIIVTWDPPADTGGAAITSYVITVTDPNGLSTEYVYNGTSNPTGATSCTTGRSCTINSVLADDGSGSYVAITDDVEYTITVTAVTSAGQSPPSSDSVVVSGQPDAPTNVATTPGFESFDVCWTAPTGSLTKYKIVAVVGLARYERQFDASDPSPASCTGGTVGTTVTSWDDGSAVTAGTTYTLNVAATVSPSDYIFGLPSENVTVLPYGLPGAPTITEITTTATSATITWSAAANYGSAITGYVARTASGEACPSTVSLTCVISDLTGNATYSFTVVATNVAGDGPPSAAVNATIDATAPTPTWGSPTIGDSRRPSATGTFDEYVYFTLTFDEVATGFDATDLTNAGTATGCVFQRSTVVPNRSFNVSVVCASVGTLIARVKSGQVTDSAGNTGPSLNVDAALVTLNDPSSTTTTAAPTTTTIAATTTTAPISAASTSTTVGATTTSTTAPDGSAGSPGARADSGSTTTTLPSGGQGGGGNRSGGGSTTTTIGGGSGLPPGIDKKLDDDTGMVDEDPAAVGRPITIERCGFVPGEPVKLFVAGNLVRTATADENGCVEEEVTVPDAAGRKIVVALYAPKSKLGAKTTIAVVGSLAATGSDVDDFVVFGFGALLAGALLMSIPRRRRRR